MIVSVNGYVIGIVGLEENVKVLVGCEAVVRGGVSSLAGFGRVVDDGA